MSDERKGKIPWVPVGLGVGLLALFGLAAKAKADESAAAALLPLEPYEDPSLTHEQAAAAMYAKARAILVSKGADEGLAYQTPTSHSEVIIDQRNTATKNVPTQAQQEAWLQFKWATNALLTYKNFGADGTTWDQYVQKYLAALAAAQALGPAA
jgi:hypothetical protein